MKNRRFGIFETTLFECSATTMSAPDVPRPAVLRRFVERGRSVWWCAIPQNRTYLIQAAIRRGWKIVRTGVTVYIGSVQWFIDESWLTDKLLDVAQGRLFSRLRLFASVFFPTTYLLTGTSRSGNEKLRVVLRGQLKPFRYYIHRHFADAPHVDTLGRSPIWRWKRQLLELDAPILWTECPAWLARLLSLRIGFAIPEIVNMRIDIKTISAQMFLNKKISVKVQKILSEHDWHFQRSNDIQDLHEFYYSDYMPTVRRKFDDDRYILPFSHMRRIFKHGYLLHVKDEHGVKLGSMLLVKKGNEMWLAYSSLRHGSAEIENMGVFRANIYGAFLRAYEDGCESVDMGTSHPILSDGIVLHKRMWGAEPCLPSLSSRSYWAVFDTQCQEAQDFLIKTPFLNYGSSGLEPVIHYNPRETSRREQLTQYQRNWAFNNVAMTRFVPLQPVYSPVDRRLPFLLKPIDLWPVISGFAVRTGVALKNILSRDSILRRYQENPSKPPKELKEWQRNQLLDFLEHAKTTVPYYETVLAGFDRATFSMDWFRSLPLMNRKDVAMNPSRYLSRSKFPVTAQAHTSGTTGSPITIKVEARSIAAREETQRRGRQWWGHKRGQRTIKLSGRLEPIGWRRLQWDRWIENIHYVDAYKLTGREGYDFYTRLLRTPHSLVYGYASALSELARYWYERGWTVPSGWLKMVILTGDMASAQQKALIESVFGAPTVSEYGCTEFYVIAMECPDGGWHLETDRLLVEIIDENGRLVPPFTPGQVVITGFDTKAMPLIRYPLGDMATYSSRPCVCGRSLPLLNDVLGRENDYIELPSGGRAPGLAMSTVLESAYANIGQPLLPWRGIQKSRDLIHFLLTEKQTSKALEDSVRVELQKLDSRFVARFEYVPTLQWREGQKRARFVSEIKLAVEVR